MKANKHILIIYTGGTIGMIQTARQPYLRPANFKNIKELLPEISRMPIDIEFKSFGAPIDSSNMTPEVWVKLAEYIGQTYDQYDGFLILHGTDTMAYTAAALSFMLEGLQKPVLLTGSQLPVDVIRTDARENLVTALDFLALPDASLPEVAICFDSRILRGNRSTKNSSEKFQAFISPNYPPLVEAGVHLELFKETWYQLPASQPLKVHLNISPKVGLIKFYPGIPQAFIEMVLALPGFDAIVLETYGTGNLPDYPWFITGLQSRIAEGLIVLNVTQCAAGRVLQEKYKNSNQLLEIGVISGRDLTTEAAICKLMFLLGNFSHKATIKQLLEKNLRGEMSER